MNLADSHNYFAWLNRFCFCIIFLFCRNGISGAKESASVLRAVWACKAPRYARLSVKGLTSPNRTLDDFKIIIALFQ